MTGYSTRYCGSHLGSLRYQFVGNLTLLALLTLGSATAFAQVSPPPSPSPEAGPAAQPQPVYHDPASQVDVYDVLTEDMFPAAWHEPKIAASALPIATAERDRALRLVKVALSKYPPAFLQANLKRVYLVGGLMFKGVSAAATNSATSLYIKVQANNRLYTDLTIENSFHHELGHLLQRNYRA